MKIRRYIGKDSHEAMSKVRMDLGSDAIILNTRKIKQKGLLKLFSKPLIEVLAAIDENATKVTPNTSAVHEVSQKPLGVKKVAVQQNTLNQRQLNKKMQMDEVNKLENRVDNIERLLEKIYNQMQPGSGSAMPNHYVSQHSTFSKNMDKISKVIKVLSNNLISNSVDGNVVNEIVHAVEANMSNFSSINDVAAKMYNHIVSILGQPQPIQLTDDTQKGKVIAFVGPTGAGKTTTLAKIAAIYSIDYHKDIGIISADTYRIAAVEQLKTYAGILGVPVNVIYSPQEVNEAIENFAGKDLILIDTAGRSHKDQEQFEELKSIIEAGEPDEIFLLISLTTDYNVCKEIMRSYEFLKNYKIIFTKMDEAATPGIILNAKKLVNSPLSYITTGQSVPDDIEIADIDKIAKKLLGSIRI